MTLLVWVAARKGVAAIASWHDPAGVTILVACFFSLWGLGAWLQSAKSQVPSARREEESAKNQAEVEPSTINYQLCENSHLP